MKKIFCLTIFFCLFCEMSGYAQSTRTEREKAWRKERLHQRAKERAMQQLQDSMAYEAAVNALQEGGWMLEVNNINFFNGITCFVSSSTNYISCDDGMMTIQTAYANFAYSPNGLGGMTVQGDVSDMRLSKDRDGNVYCNFSFQGNVVSATVSLILTAGTNQASITVSPNFSLNSIVFDGYLVPSNGSER